MLILCNRPMIVIVNARSRDIGKISTYYYTVTKFPAGTANSTLTLFTIGILCFVVNGQRFKQVSLNCKVPSRGHAGIANM
jgi:hypothetical protein